MFRYGKMQLKRNFEARSFRDLRDLVKNSERQKKKRILKGNLRAMGNH